MKGPAEAGARPWLSQEALPGAAVGRGEEGYVDSRWEQKGHSVDQEEERTREQLGREPKHRHRARTTAKGTAGEATTPDAPPQAETPPPTPPDQVFLLDGDWPLEETNTSGVVSVDTVALPQIGQNRASAATDA